MKITACFEGLIKHQDKYTFFGDLVSNEDIEISVYPCLYVKGRILSSKSILCDYRLMASGDIVAKREIRCGRDIKAGGDIEAEWLIKSGGEIEAQGRVKCYGDIETSEGIYAESVEAADIDSMGNIEAESVTANNIRIDWGEVIIKRRKQ